MALMGDNKESDPPSKRRNIKTLPSLHELANKRELHHLIPAALSGSDINARYDHEKTLLHLLLESGCSLETLNVLKDAGADIGARDVIGYNALFFALRGDCSDEVINELLEYDWGIFFQESCSQREAFTHLAAHKKRLYVFIPVIVKHQKIDYRYSFNLTLLHLPLRYNCARSVKLILQLMSPSSLNETDDNGNTYLHFAAQAGCGPPIIRDLVNAGLNPATKNKYGETALHTAIRTDCPLSVETILQFMNPSSLNETDGDGDTYLHDALKRGCGSEIILALLNAGLNPATKNNEGDNALHLLISDPFHDSIDFRSILKELLRGHPEIVDERDRHRTLPIDRFQFSIDYVDDLLSNAICTISKYVLLQNGTDWKWNRWTNDMTVVNFFRGCISDLKLLRAFMVTDTMSLGDLVKACYVSPKFVNELRVEKRFVRVLQFKEELTVYEKEVRNIVRMVRVCSSLYGKTLPFPVLKTGSYVNVSQKVLDYLNVDDLEKLRKAINFA